MQSKSYVDQWRHLYQVALPVTSIAGARHRSWPRVRSTCLRHSVSRCRGDTVPSAPRTASASYRRTGTATTMFPWPGSWASRGRRLGPLWPNGSGLAKPRQGGEEATDPRRWTTRCWTSSLCSSTTTRQSPWSGWTRPSGPPGRISPACRLHQSAAPCTAPSSQSNRPGTSRPTGTRI